MRQNRELATVRGGFRENPLLILRGEVINPPMASVQRPELQASLKAFDTKQPRGVPQTTELNAALSATSSQPGLKGNRKWLALVAGAVLVAMGPTKAAVVTGVALTISPLGWTILGAIGAIVAVVCILSYLSRGKMPWGGSGDDRRDT
jgi:Flp pilus assembly protein TadB